MKREEKGWRELMEKRRGTNGLYACQRDRAGRWERAPTPYQTWRAVRVVTGSLHWMWQLTGSQIAEITCPETSREEI
jgi:hypothetical protein